MGFKSYRKQKLQWMTILVIIIKDIATFLKKIANIAKLSLIDLYR